jgi:putative hemolysin
MDSEPPPADSFIGLLFIAVVLIVFSLLFSASESAFLSLNKLRVRFLREKRDKAAMRAGKLLDHTEELLNTLLVANELVNVALSVILTTLALKLFGPAGVGIATAVTTVLLLVFGEITPKTVATRHPEQIAFGLSRFVSLLSWILRPLVILFTTISRICLRFFGVDTKDKVVSFTEDEIKTFIDVGGEEGVLEKGEKTMMNRVFKFSDLAAVDIMVPRRSIVAIHPSDSYRNVVELSERTRLSRFPVMRRDIDDIIGVLYVKDLLYYTGLKQDFSVEKVMHSPLFIPGTTKMSSIQQMLRENKQSFAIVIDEYSGTDGILTTEDITREIFGAVADEYQQSGRATGTQISDTDDVKIDGSARLSDLQEAFHLPLESHGNETIAGYICDKLGHIPSVGETLSTGTYRFTVVTMDGLRIAQVHCIREKIEQEESV